MIGEQLLEQALAEAGQERFPATEWRPSELGHPCDRYLVWKRTGVPAREPDPKTLGYFQRGRIVEDWVLGLYRRRWPRRTRRQFPVAIPVNGELTLTGHVDLWVPGAGLVVEVKSVSPSVLDSGSLPRLDHLLQVRLYLDALGRHFGRDDLHAELVYVSLGRELAWRVFPVYPNALQVQEAKARVVLLEGLARSGQVPEVRFWPEQYPCSWPDGSERRTCPFFERCHGSPASSVVIDEGFAHPRVGDLAREWEELKTREEALRQEYEEVRTMRRGLEEQEIVPLARQHGTEILTDEEGQIALQVRWRPGRTTYDIPSALACGAVTEAQLAPFRREGRGWWEVRIQGQKGATEDA